MTDNFLRVLQLERRPAVDAGGSNETSVEQFTAAPPGEGFLFGGLTMALGLRAATLTIDDGLVPKSLHTLFMRPGLWGPALELSVTRVNDSRAFALRRIAVTQGGRLIAELVASLHRPETGEDRQHVDAPSVPPPSQLATAAPMLPVPGIMEVRPIAPIDRSTGATVHPYWARFEDGSAQDTLEQFCAAAFVSDYLVIFTPFPPGSTHGAQFLSRTLSHTLFFHRPIGTEWLLLSADPLTVGVGRFTTRGTIHDEEGRLVASFVQEGILRPNGDDAL